MAVWEVFHLAVHLRAYVSSQEVRLAQSPLWIERLADRLRFWLARHPSRKMLKGLLVVGFSVVVAEAVIKVAGLVSVTSFESWSVSFGNIIIVSGKPSYVVQHPFLLLAHSLAILATGLCALSAVIYLLTGRDRLGLRAGTLALILALTIVNLITFYFNQLVTVADAIGQLVLLFLTQVYRWRFYASQPAAGGSSSAPATAPFP